MFIQFIGSQVVLNFLATHYRFTFLFSFDHSDPVIPAESKTILKDAGIRNFSL